MKSTSSSFGKFSKSLRETFKNSCRADSLLVYFSK
jgi:hypothetical protein